MKMKKEVRKVQYYFDSRIYNKIQIIETLEKEKKEFPSQKIETQIEKNSYGIYIATLIFKDKKEKDKKRKSIFKIKNSKIKKESSKEKSKMPSYGQYKQTGILYRPF